MSTNAVLIMDDNFKSSGQLAVLIKLDEKTLMSSNRKFLRQGPNGSSEGKN
jgi:hypothetical protein